MNKNRNIDCGFTLVEILVVLAIIVMITAVVIFNIARQRQDSALLRSAQTLSLNLRQAESFALSSKVFKTQGVPCGWGIHFSGINSTSYIIFADLALNQNCSDRDFIRNPNGSEDFATVNFDTDISISGLSSGLSDIVFSPPAPKVNFRPDQTTAGITLVNKNLFVKTVTVNKVGLISSP